MEVIIIYGFLILFHRLTMIPIIIANVGKHESVWEVLLDHLSCCLKVFFESIPVFFELLLCVDIVDTRGDTMFTVITCHKQHIDVTINCLEPLQHVVNERRRRITIDAAERGWLA